LVTQEATLVSDTDWAVPTETDFTTLINYLIAQGFNYDDTTTGNNKIGKAVSKATGWNVSAVEGAVGNTDYAAKRNITGLSISGEGYRNGDGEDVSVGVDGLIWTASEDSSTKAYIGAVKKGDIYFQVVSVVKLFGANIRLVRTASIEEQALVDGTEIVDAYTGNDEKVYQGVKLGTQIWLKENLAETLYSDGTKIIECQSATVWAALTVPALCSYDNDLTNSIADKGELRWKDNKKMPADQISYDGVTVKETLDDLWVSNSYKIISAAYTLLATDSNIEISENTFIITLPTAVDITGKKYTIINAGTGVVTLTPAGSEMINGDASFSLNQWDAITIISNGTNWRII